MVPRPDPGLETGHVGQPVQRDAHFMARRTSVLRRPAGPGRQVAGLQQPDEAVYGSAADTTVRARTSSPDSEHHARGPRRPRPGSGRPARSSSRVAPAARAHEGERRGAAAHPAAHLAPRWPAASVTPDMW